MRLSAEGVESFITKPMTIHPSHYKIACPFCGREAICPNSDLGKLAECRKVRLQGPQCRLIGSPGGMPSPQLLTNHA